MGYLYLQLRPSIFVYDRLVTVRMCNDVYFFFFPLPRGNFSVLYEYSTEPVVVGDDDVYLSYVVG